jgi:hypothetical protein
MEKLASLQQAAEVLRREEGDAGIAQALRLLEEDRQNREGSS